MAAPFTVVSATSLTLAVPATAATGTAFTVLPPASTITSFTPSLALAGAAVTLTGSHYGPNRAVHRDDAQRYGHQ
ncbi:hypothetical protein [Hymenobacter elongatus]|uniref:hypothetical protein n=1 Tax=Hymenobacter elongatus TaxID=877208 RepID=UPI0014366EBD|nr:hypothetical protein [Hymenobacter elongatus]